MTGSAERGDVDGAENRETHRTADLQGGRADTADVGRVGLGTALCREFMLGRAQ
jgi:hypothetical protein